MHLLLVFCTFVLVDGRTTKFSKRSRNVERHRHSTRVLVDKPSSILLPPTEDLFMINVPEAEVSFNDVIPPPFNYLVPPYFDQDELKNYTFNDTVESHLTFNLSDFAFFLSDLFDLDNSTTISDMLNNFTTVSNVFSDFTTVPTTDSTTVFDSTSSATFFDSTSSTVFGVSNPQFVQPTEANESDSKVLIAEESGDFRNKVLAEKNYDYGDYNYESEYTEPPSRNVERVRNTTKICENRSGYVADVANGCQSFFICTPQGAMTPMSCPNGTLFSQDFLVCDWWYNVECI